MTCIKDLVFRAFRRLHNDDEDGGIWLPPDAPEELLVPYFGEVTSKTIMSLNFTEGFWIKNCNVWISSEQIKEQLKQLEDDL